MQYSYIHYIHIHSQICVCGAYCVTTGNQTSNFLLPSSGYATRPYLHHVCVTQLGGVWPSRIYSDIYIYICKYVCMDVCVLFVSNYFAAINLELAFTLCRFMLPLLTSLSITRTFIIILWHACVFGLRWLWWLGIRSIHRFLVFLKCVRVFFYQFARLGICGII